MTAIPVTTGTPVVFAGDSITQQGWFSSAQSQVGGTDLLVDQLSPPVVGARSGSVSGRAASVVGTNFSSVAPSSGGGQIYAINSGHFGDKVADLASQVAPRITNYNPQVIVILIGVNDIGVTSPSSFSASYASLLAQIQAWNPAVPVICLSIFTFGEQWTSPPLAWSAASAIQCVQFNVLIQAACSAAGVPYIDINTPLLTWESLNNLPMPGVVSGLMTQSALPAGIHPTAIGQEFISDLVYPSFTFAS
jgi:lysophospholipase L1-like esterase